MNIPIITVTNQLDRIEGLATSAHRNGWVLHCCHVEWKGFGTKLIATYEYLKEHPEIERFVFADAHDVIVLGTPDEFESKLARRDVFLSCEKGLWPPTLIPFRSCYPDYEHGFNYINSGLYYMTSQRFIELYDLFPPFYEVDDQIWLNLVWLLQLKGHKYPDFDQSIFNSHSFISDVEYGYENGRVQILGNQPCFLHKNGGTIDEKLNKMLEGMGL